VIRLDRLDDVAFAFVGSRRCNAVMTAVVLEPSGEDAPVGKGDSHPLIEPRTDF
jgi:hypothetical protein